MHQREGEVEPALHAAGVCAGALLGVDVVEAHRHQQALGRLARLVARRAEQLGLQHEQFAGRHQRVEADVLQGHADRLAHLAALLLYVVAGHAWRGRR